jgi:putative transposase
MAKTQTLSFPFPLRLPDERQAEALRLLDASRDAIHQIITNLWPQLDLFAADRGGQAWQHVENLLITRSGHGNRQERNEMEQAGRILRAQATRKQRFQIILPLLTTGLIIPAQGKRPARKDHREMREQVRALQKQMKEARDDPESCMALTNLLEQACNA